MNIGEQFFLGIRSYGSAFQLIDKYRLWKILIFPSLVSLAIAVIVGILAWISSSDFLVFLTNNYSLIDQKTPFGRIVSLLLVFIVRGMVLFFYLKVYRYLVLILLSPIFVNISHTIHLKITGKADQTNIWYYCLCAFRGIKLALRNLFFELLITLGFLFLALIIIWLIPLIPAILLVVESYFYGMIMLDYRFEQDGLNRQQSRKLILKSTSVAISNGLVFNTIILIPVIGIMVGPVLSLIAARAATDNMKF